MDKKEVSDALQQVRANSSKRNFSQSVDLIINLKDLNLKVPENQVQLFIPLPAPTGKKVSICGFVAPEMKDASNAAFDETITVDDFEQYQKEAKKTKKLASKHTFFVAQATIMPKVAQTFGRILGTRGKMPNPKAGCVVPPGANLEALSERLQKTSKITAKTQPTVQVTVGNDKSKDEDIIENVMTIYDQVVHALPNDENNVKNIMIKFTMGPPVIIGKKQETKKTSKKSPAAEPEDKTEGGLE